MFHFDSTPPRHRHLAAFARLELVATHKLPYAARATPAPADHEQYCTCCSKCGGCALVCLCGLGPKVIRLKQ